MFLTGGSRRLQEDTVRWLEREGFGGHPVTMRPDGDRRPAAMVKLQLLRELAAGRHVAVVVDDDDLVCGTMGAAGYRTQQGGLGRTTG